MLDSFPMQNLFYEQQELLGSWMSQGMVMGEGSRSVGIENCYLLMAFGGLCEIDLVISAYRWFGIAWSTNSIDFEASERKGKEIYDTEE